MKTFKQYLQQRRLTTHTIKSYHHYLAIFFNWLQGEEAQNLQYSDLLGYLQHCHERGLQQAYIRKLLRVVRLYYRYLQYTNQRSDNPATGLHVKSPPRRLPHDLLEASELETLYQTFPEQGPAQRRNKVMAGLIIYQAVSRQELDRLMTHHLDLEAGRITIPATPRSHRRQLKLEARQMAALQRYLDTTRPLILAMREIEDNDRLFISTGKSKSITGSIDKLLKQLRKQHQSNVDITKIRQSRIALWTQQYGLREAQYMAGHKYISSTEPYEATHMQDLQESLDRHHPLE